MEEIYSRRSIRKYTSEAVPEETLLRIVDAGRMAPSAKNRQPWKFLVYEGKAKGKLLDSMEKGIEREKKSPALPKSAFGIPDAVNTLRVMRQAPAVIIVMDPDGFSPFEQLDTDQRFKEINSTLSVGAAIENMILRAQELGYGTLWIGNTCFAYEEMMKEIGSGGQLVGAVAVGCAAEEPAQRPRKKLEEIAEFRS